MFPHPGHCHPSQTTEQESSCLKLYHDKMYNVPISQKFPTLSSGGVVSHTIKKKQSEINNLVS